MALVTGADIATAMSMPAASSSMDSAAVVADALIREYITTTAATVEPAPVKEAALVLAIDVWQNRTAAGGQSVGIDGSFGPYRMGRSLIDRVQGLLGPWFDVRSEIA